LCGFLRGFVLLRYLRFDEQERVIKLDIRIAQLEVVECAFMLAVGDAEEVAGDGAFDDRLLKDTAGFQARQVQVTQGVFP
jgi:hypothetical protein